jgi:putative endonuclease
MHDYFVYVMTNVTGMLYVGVTSNLEGRVYQHKMKLIPGFTSRYNLTQLVYYEWTEDVVAAITREKQIKGWLRKKKVALIESMNPGWRDLSSDWNQKRDASFRSA